jgi:osmoprotectant transport system ATP-binding protein
VLDAEGRPLGWHHDRTGGATANAQELVPGGSLYDAGSGSLRAALDAALSSPSGQGVAVDDDGRVIGGVAADDVLAALAAARRHEAA